MSEQTKQIDDMQDPHKHALYRPHHGDMTGFRFLESHELPLKTDDWATLNPCGGKLSDSWTPCGHMPVDNKDIFAYRRRVAPAEKPADQPRFVTIIVKIKDSESLGDISNKLSGYEREFREGNALSILDGLEDRCKLAIHKAFTGGVV